jgi:hypothetical protein
MQEKTEHSKHKQPLGMNFNELVIIVTETSHMV